MTAVHRFSIFASLGLCALAAACDSSSPTSNAASTTGGLSVKLNPCSVSGTLSLAAAATANVDCSAGGTTLTLAGNGASYLIVPQFPTNTVAPNLVSYQMFTGSVAAASASMSRLAAMRAMRPSVSRSTGTLPRGRNVRAQRAAEKAIFARASHRPATARLGASRQLSASAGVSRAVTPPVGSTRSFHVANSFTGNTWTTVGARLAFAGANVLVYIDTMAPAGGFTPAQLTAFGQLFDQTMYPIDTTAFGGPSDIDGNGHVIMLMSPVVNADSPKATCQTDGYVAGFFDPGDFDGPTDPNSNQGEIFYSIVPDTTGIYSCAHGVGGVGQDVPATFLHELQHLINYSQHVIVSGGAPGDSWMDEGMSIVAEELGSVYYEQKCPPPACRSDPSQIFPDSSQGFVSDFLYDSYQYALLPDTATITLSTDDEDGFSWRGGAWLFMRWLGDQNGAGLYKQLERGPSNAFTDVQQATGQTFPALFANFGLALYTDSLPGMARTTAPAANRFVSRNVKQLWARLFATEGNAFDIPFQQPVQLFPISNDTTTAVLLPGTMTFFRLDTPPNVATVTIQFAASGGAAFPPALHAQMAVFRLPPGQ